tara:strand:- start:488 stop:670 length:183 start_codon:yes stop_codon:yes gene_type:complete
MIAAYVVVLDQTLVLTAMVTALLIQIALVFAVEMQSMMCVVYVEEVVLSMDLTLTVQATA